MQLQHGIICLHFKQKLVRLYNHFATEKNLSAEYFTLSNCVYATFVAIFCESK